MNITYDEAPAKFVSGSAAMLYDGSWNAAEIEKADPNFEYDYFAIPGDTKHNFTGKYDLTFGINADSKNAKDIFTEWNNFANDGKTFKGLSEEYDIKDSFMNLNNIVSKDKRVKGHRHDQTALSFLAWKYKLDIHSFFTRNLNIEFLLNCNCHI